MQNKYELVYKTNITPFFPMCLMAQSYCKDDYSDVFGVKIGATKPLLAVLDKDALNWIWHNELKAISEKLLDNFFSDKKYIKNAINKEKIISKRVLSEIKTPPAKLFHNRNLTEPGKEKLERIFKFYLDYGYYVDVPGFLFQIYYVDKMKKEFFRELKGKTQKEKEEMFHLLLSSSKKTNYERFLSRMYNHIIEKKSKSNLGKISADFYWVVHDYLGNIMDVGHLSKEVKKMRKKTTAEMKLELKEVEGRIKEIKNMEKELSSEFLRKAKILQDTLYLYNERKKQVAGKVNIYLRRVIEHKNPKITPAGIKKIYQLLPQEVIQWISGGTIKDLETRSQKAVYIVAKSGFSNGDMRYFALVEPKQKTKGLSGSPACYGNAKGRVNIVLNISHIGKFKQGDILVAPFTNVNYLPIMRKAKAILTETGGVTSHAAIVSRELKKPCIVGIKNLIAQVRDGDMVEVDAEKGVVVMLKNKKVSRKKYYN